MAAAPVALSASAIDGFRRYIRAFYRVRGRDFLWRRQHDPYTVVLSEFMLQQTQTERVAVKLPAFMDRFPTLRDLADARLQDVLSEWVGLGYNRRARFLHESARHIRDRWNGTVPADPAALRGLPGFGVYTACAVVTFAYNIPTVFIETNIRRVFIYHFFDPGRTAVADSEIFPLIEAVCDSADPRTWYWALMDYGAYLKRTVGNPNARSSGYQVQKPFEGSTRQIRGALVRLLARGTAVEAAAVPEALAADLGRPVGGETLAAALESLAAEGMIRYETEGGKRILTISRE